MVTTFMVMSVDIADDANRTTMRERCLVIIWPVVAKNPPDRAHNGKSLVMAIDVYVPNTESRLETEIGPLQYIVAMGKFHCSHYTGDSLKEMTQIPQKTQERTDAVMVASIALRDTCTKTPPQDR